MKYSLTGFPAAQTLLDGFVTHSYGAPELARIRLAEELCSEWKKQNFPADLLPALPERGDYWYLVQLIGDRRHVDKTGSYLPFDIGTEKEITIVPTETILPPTTEKLTRDIVDRILKSSPGIDHIRFDDYLRLRMMQPEQEDGYIHFAGFRKRLDGKLMGLMGGTEYFGGARYVDSFWPDMINANATFLFSITKKI
jgi:hypothetical protein